MGLECLSPAPLGELLSFAAPAPEDRCPGPSWGSRLLGGLPGTAGVPALPGSPPQPGLPSAPDGLPAQEERWWQCRDPPPTQPGSPALRNIQAVSARRLAEAMEGNLSNSFECPAQPSLPWLGLGHQQGKGGTAASRDRLPVLELDSWPSWFLLEPLKGCGGCKEAGGDSDSSKSSKKPGTPGTRAPQPRGRLWHTQDTLREGKILCFFLQPRGTKDPSAQHPP